VDRKLNTILEVMALIFIGFASGYLTAACVAAKHWGGLP